MFELHSQLQNDCEILGQFDLSLVLLNRDANYPWCILVPMQQDLTELHHLAIEDRQQFMAESCRLAETMVDVFNPIKMNVAALGNMVPQLHIHHIARFKEDAAWPGPVWGVTPRKPYSDEHLEEVAHRIVASLTGEGFMAR